MKRKVQYELSTQELLVLNDLLTSRLREIKATPCWGDYHQSEVDTIDGMLYSIQVGLDVD